MPSKPFKISYKENSTQTDIDYRAIYTSCFPMVRSMVLKNSGSMEDARDIFQESIIILYQNCEKEKFHLSVSTCTYLYSIARNKWLKHIRDHGRISNLNSMDDWQDENLSAFDDEKKQKQRLLMKYFHKLGDKCQLILKLFFDGKPGEQITKEFGFASYEYYRVAKNRCTENLKNKIQQDPLFKELKRL
jgi:RNA polymerase sigma factor (sigma-70 family)